MTLFPNHYVLRAGVSITGAHWVAVSTIARDGIYGVEGFFGMSTGSEQRILGQLSSPWHPTPPSHVPGGF